MKKLFTILLVCTFAFSTVTFIGCGGDDAGTGDAAATDDAAADDAADDDEEPCRDDPRRHALPHWCARALTAGHYTSTEVVV